MAKRRHRQGGANEFGQSWGIAACLWDGPCTAAEIEHRLWGYLRFAGLMAIDARLTAADKKDHVTGRLGGEIDHLVAKGWVERQGDRYALTDEGRRESSVMIQELRASRDRLLKLMRPETVSKATVFVHLGLAAIKLPAGLLSGSVGLTNDAVDTLLDGISSIVVYAGLRWDRERLSNVFLVVAMLMTGVYTLYQAVRRFWQPSDPNVDWFAFVAAGVSALVCGLLGLYQRFAGVKGGAMALVTQSIDSRNHVIVAATVVGGLLASVLEFPLLDTLVGLAVAALILKSAIELGVEVIRSAGEGDSDLSRYRPGLAKRFDRFRQGQLSEWMLYLVRRGDVSTQEELLAEARATMDYSTNPVLREVGVASAGQVDTLVEDALQELIAKGWLRHGEEETIELTPEGAARLRKRYQSASRTVHTRWPTLREPSSGWHSRRG